MRPGWEGGAWCRDSRRQPGRWGMAGVMFCEPRDLYNIINQYRWRSRLTEPNYLCLLGEAAARACPGLALSLPAPIPVPVPANPHPSPCLPFPMPVPVPAAAPSSAYPIPVPPPACPCPDCCFPACFFCPCLSQFLLLPLSLPVTACLCPCLQPGTVLSPASVNRACEEKHTHHFSPFLGPTTWDLPPIPFQVL